MQRLVAAAIVLACARANAGPAKLEVTSPAFKASAEIPRDHTCEGKDVAPPLAWTGAPAATKTFALVVDDPDAPDPAAPKRTWVHWVLANIPATTTKLAGAAPDGAIVGNNDWSKATWGGPCPPIGRHRYFFKVYALDAAVGKAGMTKDELLAAMKGHVLAQGELIGTYQKKK
jgi:Raf kinase inhibitor-like YbhB/YbcL family protein